MKDVEQRAAAKAFAVNWKNKGYEKGESQPFWLSLLRDVFGVEHPEQYIAFEDQVMLDHTSFIDGTIPTTHVLIEQKGLGKDLRKAIKQSDGSLLTPFQQAKRYAAELPYSQRPRWIVTCNFSSFLVYDMEQPGGEPEEILLENLEKEYYRLNFLVDSNDEHLKREMDVSIAAGEIVGLLYDAFLKEYKNPESKESLHSLNVLCVRLVFCLYAEDAGIFGRKGMFHDYLAGYDAKHMRKALIELFEILDTQVDDRDPYLDEELAAFPYVNGGLFSDDQIEIPYFTEEIRELVLVKSSEDFDWSEISPTIFGAVFESTLNPETRRSGGMHYTSIENIHKVIDPLFLDELKEEFETIKEIKVVKTQKEKLEAFQTRLAALTWLDPACGSGNFLTETFLSVRRLENQVIATLIGLEKGQMMGQMVLGQAVNPIQVSISQFYGIEINDFAVTVAKTAMWIAESQMMKQTENLIHMQLDFLPLKSYVNIVEGNALQMDWEDVIVENELDYIMGNPPFIGASLMNSEQKKDTVSVIGKIKLSNSIDYVGAWYIKAARYMQKNRKIQTAFVSTNSITQGEQVYPLWNELFNKYGVEIAFAYRTFVWNSESSETAKVHCVIIGLKSKISTLRRKKYIFDGNTKKIAENISPYIIDAPSLLVDSYPKPICNVPICGLGNTAKDEGNLILSKEERDSFIKKYPHSQKFIRRFIGGRDFIRNDEERYCFWLKGISPNEYNNIPELIERIKKVKEFREKSSSKDTRKTAETPYLFFRTPHIESTYLIIPRTTSQRRRYIPLGFVDGKNIGSDAVMTVYDASLYHFGILISNVHASWLRTVGGRLKSDYRYSGVIVYNTFPWPEPTAEQKAKIEQTAQGILNARALYPDCSLADLYDELTMPPELRRAHQLNDKAVMAAYGWKSGDEAYKSESGCVAELMKLYQKLTENSK